MKPETVRGDHVHRIPKGIPNPELYQRLQQWRTETASRNGQVEYEVLPNLTLKELVASLPKNTSGLRDVAGIGKGRLRKYGQELLEIIQKYCTEKKICESTEPNKTESRRTASSASQNKQISFAMYKAGKSITQIATERGLAVSTISGHLAHFVGTGELDIFLLLEPEKAKEIEQYFVANPQATSAEAKSHFGDKYDYSELKMVIGHLQYQRENPDGILQ